MQNARRIALGILVVGICISCIILFLPRQQSPQQKLSRNQLYSYLVGYELYNQLKGYQPNHTLVDIINGMRACHEGLPLPDNMTKEQKAQFLNEMECELFHASEEANCQKAEMYLLAISKEESTTVCVPSRLYYQCLSSGTGERLLLPDATAQFEYTITTPDNKEVFTTQGQGPKAIYLPDAIPGFAQGVVGMSKNEKRKLYIHPDLAYRSTGWMLPPQSLLIIEVELVDF